MRFDPMEPMALLPEYASELVSIVRGSFIGRRSDPPKMQLATEDGNLVELAEDSIQTAKGMLAVVPLWGALSPSGDYGGTSLDQFARTITALDNNPNVSKIVLNVTSPGGTVTGTPEAAAAVRAVRDGGRTQIVAVANGMMASAATWIGTAAQEVVVTPSGEAGSIGVISMYADWSKAYEQAGIKIDVMRVPEGKARFTGVEPLTDAMRSTLDTKLQQSYQLFKRAMADNRGVRIDQVEGKFGAGEMLRAEDAVAAGLVDRIATLDQTIAKMMTRRAPSSARAALARLELDNLCQS